MGGPNNVSISLSLGCEQLMKKTEDDKILTETVPSNSKSTLIIKWISRGVISLTLVQNVKSQESGIGSEL